MEITINQKKQSIPEEYSVDQLLSSLLPETEKGLAVAINHEIIAKSDWKTHKLQANDNLMIIRATQGG